jgi:hypothetical protein
MGPCRSPGLATTKGRARARNTARRVERSPDERRGGTMRTADRAGERVIIFYKLRPALLARTSQGMGRAISNPP